MNYKIGNILFMVFLTGIMLLAGCNPFAPRLDDRPAENIGMGDQKTVEGLFQNFRYAYTNKDTIVYGKLLADDFVFTYKNYDRDEHPDVSWGRDVDMITTYNLFQAAQNLELMWDNIVVSTESTMGDTVLKEITRDFTLDIVLPPATTLNLKGKATLRLRKTSPDDVWKIVSWRDETNY